MILRNVFCCIFIICGCSQNSPTVTPTISSGTTATPISTNYIGTGSVTQGLGKATQTNLFSCIGGRVTNEGTITSLDGKNWIVPSENFFKTGIKLSDLYNPCTGKTANSFSSKDTSNVNTIVIDADGEIISGFIYADNYFELYVNGKIIGVDPVPYTPFNSVFVKFKAKRPIRYAVKLIDWEENLGLGSELQGSDLYHPGDGGFVANFSDGTVSNTNWKAQTFYISPLSAPNCVTENGQIRNSSGCNVNPTTGLNSYAIHWVVPANWYASDFDFSSWPNATPYSSSAVGPKEAYTYFLNQFKAAEFIWSSNLILDNLVLLRFTGK